MNPEELQKAFEGLKATYTTFTILYLVLSLVTYGLAAYLFSYLKKKGANHAQKEDIEAITKVVESVKEDVRFLGKQQEIHYNYFFQEKAKVLATIYGRLSALQRDLRRTVRESLSGSSETDSWYSCRDQVWEVKDLIDDSKIFLDPDLEEKLCAIIDDFLVSLQNSGIGRTSLINSPELFLKVVQKTLEDSGTKMRTTLDDLAVAFRRHIREPHS